MKHDGQSDLRDLMQGLFDDPQRRGNLTLQALREHWADVVGTGLADKTHPGRLEGHVLWVWARDSAWVYQLQYFKEDLLRSVQTFLESDAINDMRFRLGEVPERAPAPATAGKPPTPGTEASGAAPTAVAPSATRPAAATRQRRKATPADRPSAMPVGADVSEFTEDAQYSLDDEPELPLLVREPGSAPEPAQPAEPDAPPEDPQAAARAQRMARAIPDPALRARFLRAYARGRPQRRDDDEPPRS